MPEPTLTRFEQMLPEQSISHQVRKLTVRPLVDVCDLRANEKLGDARAPSKHSWNCMGYDLIPPMKSLPDRLAGAVRDKGSV